MYNDPIVGVTTSATGVAILPNTAGNTTLTILSVSMIAVGVLVLVSFIVKKLYSNIG
jgi:hypothetical protein